MWRFREGFGCWVLEVSHSLNCGTKASLARPAHRAVFFSHPAGSAPPRPIPDRTCARVGGGQGSRSQDGVVLVVRPLSLATVDLLRLRERMVGRFMFFALPSCQLRSQGSVRKGWPSNIGVQCGSHTRF